MTAPLDRADGYKTARIREARDAKPQRRAGTPARPATPPAGPAGSTPPPADDPPVVTLPGAARTSRPAPAPDTPGKPGGTQTSPQLPVTTRQAATGREPAGAVQRAVSTAPAGQAGRDAWKAAQSAHNAAKRRGRTARAAGQPGPGMIRKPPPPPPDVTAARLRDSLQRIIRSCGCTCGALYNDDYLDDLVAVADHYAATEAAAAWTDGPGMIRKPPPDAV